MRWEQSRPTLEQMIVVKELQRVPPSRKHADRLLAESQRHLASAREISNGDPEGAYQLLYDGVRKALTAFSRTRVFVSPPMVGTAPCMPLWPRSWIPPWEESSVPSIAWAEASTRSSTQP